MAIPSTMPSRPKLPATCSKKMGADGAIMLTPEIVANGAMTSLNISNNRLVSESSNVDIPTDLKEGALIEHQGKMRPISAAWGSGYRVWIFDGIIAVADAIKNNGALTSLNISNNNIGALVLPEGWKRTGRKEWIHLDGTKAQATPAKPEGAIALAAAIKTNGAMTTLTISGDESYSKPATIEASMTEADFSGKFLMASGAIMLTAFLPKCK